MGEKFSNSCNPNIFYNHTDNTFSDSEIGANPYISYFTMVVSIIFSPFLIVSPFLVPKLKSLVRQVQTFLTVLASIYYDFKNGFKLLSTSVRITFNLVQKEICKNLQKKTDLFNYFPPLVL